MTNATFLATSNRLQALTGVGAKSYTYDAAGNPTAIGATTYVYNLANRLVAAAGATYTVNALGQRLTKTVAGVTTVFVYDEQGHLLGEYDGAGTLIQETIWLEDLPIATLRPTGSGNPPPIALYYVHPDHLGSPRAITRASDNAFMWRWDNVDPFGANLPNENPAGQGSFKYALRFPGQYYDAETQTHYNYFRDYDPGTGRYEQSDPIGLRGGINTYAYVQGSPIQVSDPLGLYTCWCTLDWSSFGYENGKRSRICSYKCRCWCKGTDGKSKLFLDRKEVLRESWWSANINCRAAEGRVFEVETESSWWDPSWNVAKGMHGEMKRFCDC